MAHVHLAPAYRSFEQPTRRTCLGDSAPIVPTPQWGWSERSVTVMLRRKGGKPATLFSSVAVGHKVTLRGVAGALTERESRCKCMKSSVSKKCLAMSCPNRVSGLASRVPWRRICPIRGSSTVCRVRHCRSGDASRQCLSTCRWSDHGYAATANSRAEGVSVRSEA